MVDRNIATDYDKLETIVELQRQAVAQYVEDVVPALSAGTRLHLILYQFKGTELIRCEEIPQDSTSPSPVRP